MKLERIATRRTSVAELVPEHQLGNHAGVVGDHGSIVLQVKNGENGYRYEVRMSPDEARRLAEQLVLMAGRV